MAHQLLGGFSSLARCYFLCIRQGKCFSAGEVEQYLQCVLCEETKQYSLTKAECHREGSVALVHGERHHPDCRAPTGSPEHDSGRRVLCDERRDELDAEATNFCVYPLPLGFTLVLVTPVWKNQS